MQLHTTLAMASKYAKYSADVEIQVRESDASSKEVCDQTSVSTNHWDVPDNKTNASILIDDWDAPDNQENPRNWSTCKP